MKRIVTVLLAVIRQCAPLPLARGQNAAKAPPRRKQAHPLSRCG